jgi:uncharacterized membrane protein
LDREEAVTGSGPRYGRESSEFDRAIGFVDATFALALTLLVTGIDISGHAASVWSSIGSLGDDIGYQVIAFAISFVVIASYWLEHHRLIARFAAIDTPVIVANLALIAGVVLLPFSTKSVGDPAVVGLPLPVAVLAVNVAAVSILQTLVYVLAYRRRLLATRPTGPELFEQVASGLAPAVVFLLSIPVAYLVSAKAAQLTWIALLIVNPTIARIVRRRGRARRAAAAASEEGEAG